MAELSVNMFLAGMIVTGLAAVCYIVYTVGSWVVYGRAVTSAGEVSMAISTRVPASLGRTGTALTWLALAFLTVSLTARIIATGHPPYTNMWEFQVAFGWAALLFYGLFERWHGQRALGAFAIPLILALFIVSALFFPADVQPLVPALQAKRILALHVGTMILAYSSLSVSFVAAAVYLVQGKQNRFSRLPKQSVLDAIAYRSVALGVPLLALGIILGAWWGNSAWGRYWGWDPKETSALVTWLIYAGYLHVRGLRSWQGNRSAWLLVAGYAAVLFTYFAVNLVISGLHSYAGV